MCFAFKALGLAMAIVFTASCANSNRTGPAPITPPAPAPGAPSGDGSGGTNAAASGALDFETIESDVFVPKCTNCHGSEGGVNLQTYPNVLGNLAKIKTVIANGTMPPNGGLPNDEKQLVLNWIEAGAPINTTTPN